jgi:hypothetical protein
MRKKPRILLLILSVVLLLISAVVYFLNKDSGYSTYHPEKQDLFQVKFEYPASWEWNRANHPLPYYDDSMSTSDPTKPVYGLNEEPNFERGLIFIEVLQIDPTSFVASTFEDELLAPRFQNPYLELQMDEMIEVDGYPARRIVYRIAPRVPPMNQVPLLVESIFVTVGDRYYEFSLDIPESERLEPYGQAFDHLIDSVHFLP